MNNTVKRTLSGICFLAIVIGGLLVNKYLYAALITFMMVTMLYEFYRMTMGEWGSCSPRRAPWPSCWGAARS